METDSVDDLDPLLSVKSIIDMPLLPSEAGASHWNDDDEPTFWKSPEKDNTLMNLDSVENENSMSSFITNLATYQEQDFTDSLPINEQNAWMQGALQTQDFPSVADIAMNDLQQSSDKLVEVPKKAQNSTIIIVKHPKSNVVQFFYPQNSAAKVATQDQPPKNCEEAVSRVLQTKRRTKAKSSASAPYGRFKSTPAIQRQKGTLACKKWRERTKKENEERVLKLKQVLEELEKKNAELSKSAHENALLHMKICELSAQVRPCIDLQTKLDNLQNDHNQLLMQNKVLLGQIDDMKKTQTLDDEYSF